MFYTQLGQADPEMELNEALVCTMATAYGAFGMVRGARLPCPVRPNGLPLRNRWRRKLGVPPLMTRMQRTPQVAVLDWSE